MVRVNRRSQFGGSVLVGGTPSILFTPGVLGIRVSVSISMKMV